MTQDEECIDLTSQIAAAASRCAVLRICGPLEVYMDAFDEVEGLEKKLRRFVDRLRLEQG